MSKRDFDVLVIGGGSAGLTASGMAASLGARTALVESALPGGDCTWTGCVPSKALIKAARVAHDMRTADQYGLPASDPEIDFARVMAHVRKIREEIYQDADAPDVITARGVELITGRASFVDAHTLLIHSGGNEPRMVSSRYIVICAGASPRVPELPGIDQADILTSSSLFEVNDRPGRLLILGGGPVGIEMGQALQRLGCSVTIVERGERLLPDTESECSVVVQRALENEGVRVLTNSMAEESKRGESAYEVQIATGEEQWQTVECEKVLAAIGRQPNVGGLGLENAGVTYDAEGIAVNHSCQTNVDHIYACGDIVKGGNFTHVAENMAKTAITRILLKIPASYEREAVPGVTFSDPECAGLGKTAQTLQAKGERFRTIRFPFEKIDRGLIEKRSEGIIVIHSSLVTGRILGAHIAGPNAGEMINELALAMKNGLTLRDISQTVHAYPTWSLGVRRAADQWYVQQGSPGLLKIIGSVFHFRGEVSSDIGTDNVV